ncbi:MAG: hypothetical protein K2P84_03840 [Undibacterium sp.]|nr:hypothetical protein [Undibacterium sp.]
MNWHVHLQRWSLLWNFGLYRIGKMNLFVLITIVCCGGALQWASHVAPQFTFEKTSVLRRLENELLSKQSQVTSIVQRPIAEQNLNSFEGVLGESQYQEQDLKKILDIAHKSDIVLRMGEYTWLENAEGNFAVYRLQFPVKGTYQNLRLFVEKTLLALPNASLDEINFKRESISQTLLESRIKFSVFYRRRNDKVQATNKGFE